MHAKTFVSDVGRHNVLAVFSHFSVARFATEKVQPLVSVMDENSEMDESIIKGMFDQGVSFVLHLPSSESIRMEKINGLVT